MDAVPRCGDVSDVIENARASRVFMIRINGGESFQLMKAKIKL